MNMTRPITGKTVDYWERSIAFQTLIQTIEREEQRIASYELLMQPIIIADLFDKIMNKTTDKWTIFKATKAILRIGGIDQWKRI